MTVGVHSIPEWAAVAVLLVIGVMVWRGAGGQALSILQEANRVLSDKLREETHELGAARERISELEKTRSLEPIVAAIGEQFRHYEEKTNDRLAEHEKRAQDRADAHLAVLNLIADRLGPDDGEHEVAA